MPFASDKESRCPQSDSCLTVLAYALKTPRTLYVAIPTRFEEYILTNILQLEMADGDTLEVHQEQIGGGN